MRDGLLLIADTHGNSTTGLCPPDGIELDDGGRYQPSKAQRWLWQCYTDLLAEAEQISRTCDRFMTWYVGDLVDKIGKGSQIVTYNDPPIVNVGVQIVELSQRISHSGVGIIRGTAAHTGDSGHLEEAIAKAVGAKPYPVDSALSSSWYAKIAYQDHVIDIAHHGKVGGLPWTRANALGGIAYTALDEALRSHDTIPSLVVRAHRHKCADSGDNYPVRVVQLPCFQISNAYANQAAPRQMADIGGAFVVVEDGKLDVTFRLFRPSPEAAYCPSASTSPSPSLSQPSLPPNQAEQLI